MRSWQTEKGHLACCWSEVGNRVQYNPRWMQEASERLFGSYSGFCQPQSIRGINLLVPAPYR